MIDVWRLQPLICCLLVACRGAHRGVAARSGRWGRELSAGTATTTSRWVVGNLVGKTLVPWGFGAQVVLTATLWLCVGALRV